MFIRTEKNIYETDLVDINGDSTKVTFIVKGTRRKKTLMLSAIIYFSSKWPTKRQDADIDSFKRTAK